MACLFVCLACLYTCTYAAQLIVIQLSDNTYLGRLDIYFNMNMKCSSQAYFLRVLHPAHTVLRPARLYSALPEFNFFLNKKCNLCFCVFRQGCKNACKIAHKIVPKPRFVHVLNRDRILVIRAVNCARLCVVRALNCARILFVRALDCAQFLLHPALFPT